MRGGGQIGDISNGMGERGLFEMGEISIEKKYKVVNVNTDTAKRFSVIAFPDEHIFDLKKRIELIEGIPTAYQ